RRGGALERTANGRSRRGRRRRHSVRRPARQQPWGHAGHGGLEASWNDPVRSRAVKRQLGRHLLHHRLAMRRRGSDKEHEESSEKYGAGAEGGVWVLLQLSTTPTFQRRFVLEGRAE